MIAVYARYRIDRTTEEMELTTELLFVQILIHTPAMPFMIIITPITVG